MITLDYVWWDKANFRFEAKFTDGHVVYGSSFDEVFDAVTAYIKSLS